MGVPTSEVGYTSAMPRREDHEVHKRTCGGIGEREKKESDGTQFKQTMIIRRYANPISLARMAHELVVQVRN